MFKQSILIIILIIFICSIICITVNLTKLNQSCKTEKIIYKYVPKKTIDQQFYDNNANDLFKDIFTMRDSWVNSVMERDTYKTENINKYFISAI